jgi:hypothetical protein
MPTTFSTALPAIPTMTSPVNSSEIPSECPYEPVRDERRGHTCAGEQPDREREGNAPVRDAGGLAVAQIEEDPDAVDGEENDGAYD